MHVVGTLKIFINPTFNRENQFSEMLWKFLCHIVVSILGFGHEHTRSDRDDYIDVDYEELTKAEKENFMKYKKGFKKCNTTQCGKMTGLIVKYDTQSISHYPNKIQYLNQTSLPKDWTVIKPRIPCPTGGCYFEQSEGDLDVSDISSLYDCTNGSSWNKNTQKNVKVFLFLQQLLIIGLKSKV